MAPSISGGSVRSVDPLAGATMGDAGVVAGASILAPVVGSLLSPSDKQLVKLDISDASSITLVDEDSPSKSAPNQGRAVESVSAAPAGSVRALVQVSHFSYFSSLNTIKHV